MDFPQRYKQLWNNWDVRVLILLSLSFQIILIFLGRMRRSYNSKWLRMIVWCCYLLADSVASFVLGQLSSSMDDSSPSNAIIAFWAPFLILHLGGPDTITAYSVEDNELWARHLFWLIYQLSIAFYVIFRSLPNTRLLAPTLLILFVAIIKYLERSYSLYRASIKGFGDSIVDSWYDALPLLEERDDSSKAFQLYILNKAAFIDPPQISEHYLHVRQLTLNYEDVLKAMSMMLSYAYDEFYTKAIIIHSRVGYVFRVLCSICIALAFSLFFIAPKDDFKHVDVAITYVLLCASICLDLVATVMLVFSDWMIGSLLAPKINPSKWKVYVGKHIVIIKRAFHKRKYRLRKLPQLNLFANIIRTIVEDEKTRKNESPREKIQNWVAKMLRLVQGMKVFRLNVLNKIVLKLESMKPVQATDEIINMISSCLRSRFMNLPDEPSLEEAAGFFAFRKIKSFPRSNVKTFVLVFAAFPFYKQVLLWHIITDLCLNSREENEKMLEMEACSLLSNYVIYMVLNQSEMVAEIPLTFYGIYGDLRKLGANINDQLNVKEFCKIILNNRITMDHSNDTGNIIFLSQILVELMFVITEEEKWLVLKTIWVEFLLQLAKNSRPSWNVKQLIKGDDLLTLVWLFDQNVEIRSNNLLFPYTDEFLTSNIKEAEDVLSEIKSNLPTNSIV